MKKIKKILIANRGEIAVRIIQAAKELNIISVAVFTEVDRMALHVQKADEVYPLVQNKIEPYLDINQIIDIAEKAGVDAIHPGYGFLSENAVFAKKVKEDGFIFIGPGDESIRLMGDKLLAKQMAIDVGIDVVPGCMVDDPSDPELTSKINHIGYPIMIKARAGGGGKGMRIVYDEDQFNEQLGQSIREAEAAFGDGSVFVEKYIEKPRHIEFQILADHHGNAVHLFERECSIQRRHQKIVEEAPSAILTKTERKEMGEAALRLVKACNYTNAGTLEFILDERKHFYFLEMNTRLQVEHPVTEYITGLDLVKQQIWIAEGKPLSFAQKDLKIHGHAIELRVCAEDPSNSFLPDIGILKKYVTPNGIGIRVDNGYTEGSEIPIEYDPLIAKLIAFGSTRHEAIARMKRAIIDFEIEGVKNTLEFGRFVMNNQHFFDGEFDTGFIAREMDKFLEINDDITESMIAALVSYKFVNKFDPIKIEDRPASRNMWRERRK